MQIVYVLLALIAMFAVAAPAAASPSMCVLSLSDMDVQVAFTGTTRTAACRSALASAGPNASIDYALPRGVFPACFVLYAPSDNPAIEEEGAIVFDTGSGQAISLCNVYNAMTGLYVYNIDGSTYSYGY